MLRLLASTTETTADEGGSGLIEVVPGLMIWTLICFAIAFFVLRKFAFGPIQKAIDTRRDRIRQAVEEAEVERLRRLEDTRKQIEAETVRSIDLIRAEVADLTVLATEKVTRKTLTGDDQRKLVEETLADLDFSALAGDSGSKA